MESKWYFFPDQNEQNTKISDRMHALHVTKQSWAGITGHLDRKRLIREALEKEQQHKKFLKETSEAMTKEWPDSIENIRMRQERERQNKFGHKKDDRIEEYYVLKKEQEAIRKEYVDKVKKNMFISKGYPKQLTSALILSETLDERKKQIEFDNMIRNHHEVVEAKYAEHIRKETEEDKLQREQERRNFLEKRQKYGAELKQQIEEHRKAEEEHHRKHVEKEAKDITRAAEEMKILEELELTGKIQKRRQRLIEKKEAMAEAREREQIRLREDKELEEVTEIYAAAKTRIECLMKQKVKEEREEAVRKQDEIVRKAALLQASKEAEEEESLRKAVAERDAEEEIKIKAKAEHNARMIEERLKDRQQYLDRLEKERQAQKEWEKWEMLNRFKTDKVIKEYDATQRVKKWEKIQEYRKMLLEQIAEEKEEKKRLEEIDRLMSKVHYDADDKMFYSYADEVLEMAKQKGWTTYPILKVIEKYKRYIQATRVT